MGRDIDKERALHRWIDLANSRKLDALREVWADDLILHQGSTQLRGLDAFVGVLEVFYAGIPDLHITVEDVLASGDIAIMRSSSRGRHTGEFMGIPATGRTVSYAGINTFRFAGGKIVEEWFNDDMHALMRSITGGEVNEG